MFLEHEEGQGLSKRTYKKEINYGQIKGKITYNGGPGGKNTYRAAGCLLGASEQ